MVDSGATPKFNAGMPFCVHTNTIPVALKDCSHKELEQEETERDLMGIQSLMVLLMNKDLLIQSQDELIERLEEQVFNEEQELSEKERHIVELEIELEQVCKELVMEANRR